MNIMAGQAKESAFHSTIPNFAYSYSPFIGKFDLSNLPRGFQNLQLGDITDAQGSQFEEPVDYPGFQETVYSYPPLGNDPVLSGFSDPVGRSHFPVVVYRLSIDRSWRMKMQTVLTSPSSSHRILSIHSTRHLFSSCIARPSRFHMNMWQVLKPKKPVNITMQ